MQQLTPNTGRFFSTPTVYPGTVSEQDEPLPGYEDGLKKLTELFAEHKHTLIGRDSTRTSPALGKITQLYFAEDPSYFLRKLGIETVPGRAQPWQQGKSEKYYWVDFADTYISSFSDVAALALRMKFKNIESGLSDKQLQTLSALDACLQKAQINGNPLTGVHYSVEQSLNGTNVIKVGVSFCYLAGFEPEAAVIKTLRSNGLIRGTQILHCGPGNSDINEQVISVFKKCLGGEKYQTNYEKLFGDKFEYEPGNGGWVSLTINNLGVLEEPLAFPKSDCTLL